MNRDSTITKTEVREATLAEKPILRQLLELYEYDMSEFEGRDVGPHGLYGYRYLDNYWTEPDRHPYLILVQEQIAGFALVNRHGVSGEDRWAVAEFFVLKKYRGQGVGEYAATHIFDLWRGPWEVTQLAAHPASHTFWRKVIGKYMGGQYEERQTDGETDIGPYQLFDNSAPAEAVGAEARDKARKCTLHLETKPRAADTEVFSQILRDYNRQQAGESGLQELTVLLRDTAGQVVGGLSGATYRGWLFVKNLAVQEDFRGQDYGSRLLLAVEAEAQARGCRHAWLDTFSFQARPFYEKHGYMVFGTLEDYPPGHSRYFLRKELVQEGTEKHGKD